ncbi:tetratricopeptide repeat protein [Streptomyces sp. NPDC004783]|uniref:tetratricopeptide repeat protein n=1 Tax=Streptomyces sp. NPDC004783 TaxID=3154459 RepID=UPI0033B58C20
MPERLTERLLVDLLPDARVALQQWPSGEFPSPVGTPTPLVWPLAEAELAELRWYLESYLHTPFGVYGERGPRTAARLPEWGARIFDAVFPAGPARDAWTRARARAEARGDGPAELVVRSASAELLGLPWELMAEEGRPAPLVLGGAAITRSLPAADLRQVFGVEGARLRVLMVISRPEGTTDVGYRMIARPLLRRLEAVRGRVELVVLRPPTLARLEEELRAAQEAGEPFQIVHFDGHGKFGRFPGRAGGIVPAGTASPADAPQGLLAFEAPSGGTDWVAAGRVARVLAASRVPVVVLNACESGTVGARVEAALATRLLQEGTAAVVAMAYRVYTVAAAEFMTAFYERLFAGDGMPEAVAAGRHRLASADQRPSRKGPLALADWMVPVLYARGDVRFPELHTARGGREPIGDLLDRMRRRAAGPHRSADGAVAAADEDGLPAEVGEFVGRDAPLYLLDVAARQQRVVVLHGTGGTGKTELAKTFGRWCRDTGAVDDPSWVIWHSFEPGAASFGVDAVLDAVGRRVWGDRFVQLERGEARAATEELLADKRVLLIWDNFESAHTMPDPRLTTPPLDQEERDALRRFLRRVAEGGRSTVVITSRTTEDWLGGPDTVARVRIGGLEPGEANEYVDQLLAPYPDARRRRGSEAFGELMQWLDGHPLSMRLTLPHLQTTSAAKLLAGLRGTAPLPAGSAGDGDRTASLSACVAYSFTHLDPDDQQALGVLGLLHDVTSCWVLATFSMVSGVPVKYRNRSAAQWAAALDRAAGVGLVVPLGGGLYRVHPALPAYLAHLGPDSPMERPGTDGETAATLHALLDAHAAFSIVLAGRLRGPDAENVLAMTDHQYRTLGALLGHALDNRLWPPALGIFGLLIMYWDARGLAEESRAWLDRALTVLEPPEAAALATDASAVLWLVLAEADAVSLARSGRLDQAERAYRSVLRLAEEQPDATHVQEDLTSVFLGLGNVARMRGELDKAEDWYHKARGRQRALGDRPGLAATCHQLARVAQDRGELEGAERWYRESLGLFRELRDNAGSGQCCYGLGIVARMRGDLNGAEDWYRECLVLQHSDRPNLANTYQGLGVVARLRGELDEAEGWFRRCLLIQEELDDRSGRATTYHQLGMVDLERGELDRAERWYLRSLELKEALHNRRGLADAYHELGRVEQERGKFDRAEELFHESISARKSVDDRPGLALAYAQLALLAEERGRQVEALRWAVTCVTLFDGVPHPLTGTGPEHLKRMARDMGADAVGRIWWEVTGRELPAPVRHYLLTDPLADA